MKKLVLLALTASLISHNAVCGDSALNTLANAGTVVLGAVVGVAGSHRCAEIVENNLGQSATNILKLAGGAAICVKGYQVAEKPNRFTNSLWPVLAKNPLVVNGAIIIGTPFLVRRGLEWGFGLAKDSGMQIYSDVAITWGAVAGIKILADMTK